MAGEISLRPIGIIHSPFTGQEGTPIQPSLAGGARGWVEVFPEFEAGLDDLEGFERVWLVYSFDRAGEERLKVIPYLDSQGHGVFATRAPCRPNRIGFSCVRLLGRNGPRLEIGDIDVLDNSPLLDIKPYIPSFDSFPAAKTGWLNRPLPGEIRADSRFASGNESPDK